MSNQKPSQERESVSLWRFIPLNQYESPPEPVEEAVRKGLLGLWDRLRRVPSPTEPGAGQAEVRFIPQDLLDMIAPAPELNSPVQTLDETLREWMEAEK
ncbi:MAG: hypothetical protein ACMUIA_12740, partial [bacterium]